MGKTIRFGDLVRQSGRPEAVTLWADPKKDRSFSKAVKENRVVTIRHHLAGHRKEFGEIGFHQEGGATYLVFPRTLPRQPESRIVGINYQLAEDAPIEGPLAPSASRKKTATANVKRKGTSSTTSVPRTMPTPTKPEPKIFNVMIRRTAVLEEMERVKAFTEHKARQRALENIKHKRFVLSRAVQRDDVLSCEEAR